jgi:hypothetical protein
MVSIKKSDVIMKSKLIINIPNIPKNDIIKLNNILIIFLLEEFRIFKKSGKYNNIELVYNGISKNILDAKIANLSNSFI